MVRASGDGERRGGGGSWGVVWHGMGRREGCLVLVLVLVLAGATGAAWRNNEDPPNWLFADPRSWVVGPRLTSAGGAPKTQRPIRGVEADCTPN